MTLSVPKKRIDPTFGNRLRALREEKGWSQTRLGEEAGVRYQYIARLERAESEPGWAMVLKLAEALGVTPDDFLDDADDGDPPPEEPAKKRPPRPKGK